MTKPLFQHTKLLKFCPQCGEPLIIKQSKKGLFLGCRAYPNCDYLQPLQKNEHKILKTLTERCPQCDHVLQLKQGSFGMFIGCSNYPVCHFVVREETETPIEQALDCPECGKGQLVLRRGRQGKFFFACDQFPKCKFSVPSQPYAEPCPQCHFGVSFIKRQNTQGRLFQCANKACRHQFEKPHEDE